MSAVPGRCHSAYRNLQRFLLEAYAQGVYPWDSLGFVLQLCGDYPFNQTGLIKQLTIMGGLVYPQVSTLLRFQLTRHLGFHSLCSGFQEVLLSQYKSTSTTDFQLYVLFTFYQLANPWKSEYFTRRTGVLPSVTKCAGQSMHNV